MRDEIIDLRLRFGVASGQYLLDWEQMQLDEAVADVFGFHALQLGMPSLQGLRANRMPHRWLALANPQWPEQPDVWMAPEALPFAENSVDLVVLPHTLEYSADPHAVLREVARVLLPEGRVVVCGINPVSLWGLRQYSVQLRGHLQRGQAQHPDGQLIHFWRLRDWLQLLNFEVRSVQFGCYRPALRNSRWLERWQAWDAIGARWWPILGAVYCVVATKRVHGVHLLPAAWRRSAMAPASVPIASRSHQLSI